MSFDPQLHMTDALIVTCEHGGYEVPDDYAQLFAGYDAVLQTHRGWDPGALQLAKEMAADFRAPLYSSTTTRLLIDLNRSIGHKHLHSEATRGLTIGVRKKIAREHYHPHRDAVKAEVAAQIDAGKRVVHIASHSFTPELNGEVRMADISWLYDPRRPGERDVSASWLAAISKRDSTLRLRRNYPYHGKEDGLTSSLRRLYAPEQYVGIELELNQRFVFEGGAVWERLREIVRLCLKDALEKSL